MEIWRLATCGHGLRRSSTGERAIDREKHTLDDEQRRRNDVSDGVGRDALVASLVVVGQVRNRQVASVLQRLADHRKRSFALRHRHTVATIINFISSRSIRITAAVSDRMQPSFYYRPLSNPGTAVSLLCVCVCVCVSARLVATGNMNDKIQI